jgi:dTDP-glucose pyrophosphorylase
MFDTVKDTFHVVANREQLERHPRIAAVLKKAARNVRLVCVEPHEKGPTFSALQCAGIQDDDEIIVTYCDFIVDWDYPLFLRRAKGYAGAIPVFRGFHPASLGETRYAYLRCEDDLMLELREKRSFTPNRQEEHASAGIYYFESWRTFRKYGLEVLNAKDRPLSEAYTSLLFNPMVRDGLPVLVHEVERFICWGTPEDLERYLFWSNVFLSGKPEAGSVDRLSGRPQTNLIAMAGRGSRFKAGGYRVVKPLIQIQGKPMVISAVSTFPPSGRWIFLPREEDMRKHPVEKTLRSFAPNCEVLPVAGDTSGQAATCLLAKGRFNEDHALFIASCDYQTTFDPRKWAKITEDESIDGAIWTFRLGRNFVRDPRSFAYCRVAEDGTTVSRVVEKQTISEDFTRDPMVVGSFWYRRAGDFVDGAEAMIGQNIRVNGEHYVGTSINCLIGRGKRFVIFDVDQWISFGDPLELKVYEYWEDHFHLRPDMRLSRERGER